MSGNPDLVALWEEHLRHEFATKDTEATLETMVPHAYVNHIPVMTGGVGQEALGRFYANRFIPKMPPDADLAPISRTVGENRLVDEFVFKFTHTVRMDWMLPGVEPTGKQVRVPFIVVVQFEGDKLAHEHIYWDQATVLVQVGLLDPAGLPVTGVAQADKALDASLPSNDLING